MNELEEPETILPCAGKLSFDTTTQAEGAAATADWQHGISLKAYKCKYCALWHLASN